MSALLETFCVLVAFTPVSAALQWTPPVTSSGGSDVTSCGGHDVSLAWKYSVTAEEQLVNVEWRYRDNNGTADKVLATSVDGHFFQDPASTQRLQFIPNAGVRVLNVTSKDTGTYSVHVNSILHGSMQTSVQTANLVVIADAVTQGDHLHALIEGARFVNTTHQHQLLLSCGQFNSVWAPSVNVTWTTPAEQQLPSTFYQDGKFFLAVPNPVLSGDYSCTVDHSSPAMPCIPGDSPLRTGASVLVNGLEGRLALMESSRKEMEVQMLNQIHGLATDKARLEGQVNDLAGQLRRLKNETDQTNTNEVPQVNTTQLLQKVDSLAGLLTELRGNQTSSEGVLLIMKANNTHLLEQLHSLTSQLQTLQTHAANSTELLQRIQVLASQVQILQTDTRNNTGLAEHLHSLMNQVQILEAGAKNNTDGLENLQSLAKQVRLLQTNALNNTDLLHQLQSLANQVQILQANVTNGTGLTEQICSLKNQVQVLQADVLNNTALTQQITSLTNQVRILQANATNKDLSERLHSLTNQVEILQAGMANHTALLEQLRSLTNQVQVLQTDRVNWENLLQRLRTNNTNFVGQLQSLAAQLQQLRTDKAQTEGQIQSLKGQLDVLEKHEAQTVGDVHTLQSGSSHSEELLKNLSRNLQALEHGQANTDERVRLLQDNNALLSGRLETLTNGTQGLQTQNSHLEVEVKDLQASKGSTEGQLQVLQTDATQAKQQIGLLQNNVTLFAADLSTVLPQVQALQTDTTHLAAEISTVVPQMEALRTNASHLTAEISTVVPQVQALRTNATHLAAAISTVVPQVKALQDKDVQTEQQLKLLQVGEIQVGAEVNTLRQGLDAMKDNATETTRELLHTKNEMDRLRSSSSSDIAQLQGRLRTAESRLHELRTSCTCSNASRSSVGTVDGAGRLSRVETVLQGLQVSGLRAAGDVQNLVGQYNDLDQRLHAASQSVSFYARLMLSPQRNYVDNNRPIIFFDVATNEGNGYNPTTGMFTAPVTGVYEFHLNIMSTTNGSSHGSSVRADVVVDGVWTALAITADVRTDHDMGSADVVARLRAGQRVWVKNKWSCAYGPSGTTFSGALLHAG